MPSIYGTKNQNNRKLKFIKVSKLKRFAAYAG
jgi:hypothetical protein